MLHVLGRLVELEPAQAELLERICAGPTLVVEALRAAGAVAAGKPSGAPAAAEAAGQLRLPE